LTSAGGSTDPSGRRNQGGAPAVRMSIDTQGRVGIGRYNPSYKLDIGGNFRIGAATNSIYFDADSIYTALYADGVLRIKQRVEVWGEGTSGRQYLDVRDTDGTVKVKLDGESTSYFTRNVAIGATSATSALLVSGTGVGAAIDWTNTTATTGRSFRWVSLNSGGFAVEDLTAGGANRLTISSGGDATFAAKITAGSDIKGQRLILRSDALERWEGTGDDKAISVNYFGYNQTFDYYRDLNVYNGKGGLIAQFDGSTNRLGIKTTNPSSELHVAGDAYVSSELGVSVPIANKVFNYGAEIRAAYAGIQLVLGRDGSSIGSGGLGADANYALSVWNTTSVQRLMVIEQGGNLAVGSTDPQGFKTRVAGTFKADTSIETPQIYGSSSQLRLGNFSGNDADEWPRLYWYRDTANGWDEGLIKGNSTRGVFGRSHFGIHMDEDRSFGFHSNGWDTEMEIRGDGLTYMKGQVMIGRTSEVSNVKLAVQNAAWFDTNSQSRVLYLEGGAENGNIVQFQRYGVNKWELVGRDGTFYIYKNDGTGSGYKYQINTSGEHTLTGVVTTTSTLRAQGDVIAYYSDMRLKTKIGDIQDPIGKLQSLNGFYYEPNEIAQSYGYEVERRIGLSAQEVKEVVPEAVHDAPIGDGYMAVDYAKLVPVLVEAIKELSNKVEDLENKLNGTK
jgi:hypothetical protein